MRSLELAALLSAVVALAVAGAAAAADDGPFGLRWGMTLDELRQRGTAIRKDTLLWGAVRSVSVARVAAAPADTTSMNLAFDPELGLQRVIWYREVKNDRRGEKGRRVYAALKMSLLARYGRPDIGDEIVGLVLFDEPEDFYQCLAYEGCGVWASEWDPPNSGSVELAIEGVSRGSGVVVLTYQGPAWRKVVERVRSPASSVNAAAKQ